VAWRTDGRAAGSGVASGSAGLLARRTGALWEQPHSLTEGPAFPEPLASGFRSARRVGRRDSWLGCRQPPHTHKVAFTVFISIFYTVTLFL